MKACKHWKEYSQDLGLILKTKKMRIAVIFLCAAVITIAGVLTPQFTMRIVDEGLQKNDMDTVITYSLLLLGLHIVVFAVEILKEINRVDIYMKTQRFFLMKSLNHLFHVDLSFYSHNNSTGIYQVATLDSDVLSSVLHEETLDTVTNLFAAIGGIVSLFQIDPLLLLAVLLVFPIQMTLSYLVTKKHSKTIREYNERARKNGEIIGEIINGMFDIRFTNSDESFLNCFRNEFAAFQEISKKKLIFAKQYSGGYNLLINSLLVIIYFLSGVLLSLNRISIGGVVAFESFALMILGPLSSAVGLAMNASALFPSIDRYYDFQHSQAPDNATIAHQTIHLSDEMWRGEITFRNVSFSYADATPVIKDLSFTIPYGSSVLIIGDNGVGKTTLLNLILKLIRPTKGTICIRNTNIEEIDSEDYRALFAVLPQDAHIFNLPIRDNVCMFQNYDENDINHVFENAGIEDIVNSWNKDNCIGVDGDLLSGGQKRKIAIARTIIQEKPYVIFDEPTANLDQTSAASFFNMIKRELKQKTVLCVTHDAIDPSLFDMVIDIRKESKGH